MPTGVKLPGLGWLPDYPDFRDYTPEHPAVEPLLSRTAIPKAEALPAAVDLTAWCSPVEDQGSLGSCTANAAIGLYEYFERRAHGQHLDGSRLFVYKTARNLLHWTGDTGAFIRTAMGALVLFGVPPEEHWPYDLARFDDEPPAFCYAYAQDFKAIHYLRLDPPGTSADAVVHEVKTYLSNNYPVMFGFTVYSSIAQADDDGRIPMPSAGDKMRGGHAVMAVGYDDTVTIRNTSSRAPVKGAFKIRNSWGTRWGQSGYGWLPYEYAASGLAKDWWTLIKADWVDTDVFVGNA
jgi:C1A family cysteine protease